MDQESKVNGFHCTSIKAKYLIYEDSYLKKVQWDVAPQQLKTIYCVF